MTRILLLLLVLPISCMAFSSEKTLFSQIGHKAEKDCVSRSQDVKSAVLMRDQGLPKEQVLNKLKRLNEAWPISTSLIELIYVKSDRSPDQFYNFSMHTCRVSFWLMMQKELCPEIFPDDNGKQCIRRSEFAAKEILFKSFQYLSSK